MSDEKIAVLALSNGIIIKAKGLGSKTIRSGELVFNTSMTGYQEALTDPSYAGQILIMTYPLIGNYGFSKDWSESDKVHVEGFCIRLPESTPHHLKNSTNLDKYLDNQGVSGICGLDTRMLTRMIRDKGVIPSALQVADVQEKIDEQALLQKAKSTDYSSINFVEKVSGKEIKTYGKGSKKVALIDFGVKANIIRELNKRDIEVLVFPWDTTAQELQSFDFDGIFLTNGPGDPAQMQGPISQIKKMMDYPIMGICLGNQLLGCSAGSKTYKLKFGHRGSNHPVLEKESGEVVITTQNHGFAVDDGGLSNDWEVTHINLNDNTVEGLRHKSLPIFSVQYHPEAHPGPRDSMHLFDRFKKTL
jgi:carbamoyl-phosphate synthase small subunit